MTKILSTYDNCSIPKMDTAIKSDRKNNVIAKRVEETMTSKNDVFITPLIFINSFFPL